MHPPSAQKNAMLARQHGTPPWSGASAHAGGSTGFPECVTNMAVTAEADHSKLY